MSRSDSPLYNPYYGHGESNVEKWGEWRVSKRPGFELMLSANRQHLKFHLHKLEGILFMPAWICKPFLGTGKDRHGYEEPAHLRFDQTGFAFCNYASSWGSQRFLWRWKDSYNSFDLPWTLDHHGTWALVEHGQLQTMDGTYPFKTEHPQGYWIRIPNRLSHSAIATKWEFPYTYVNKDGSVDNVTATVYGNRMRWRRKWLPFTDFLSFQKDTLDIRFSAEVGSGKGSWKGACLGTSIEMKPGESVEETLRRAEKELKFERRR